jgi:hypothetical protein
MTAGQMTADHDGLAPYRDAIGPRAAGGRYHDGYWGAGYTVLAITSEPQSWRGWSITIAWDGGEVVSHCTGWDDQRDRVLDRP